MSRPYGPVNLIAGTMANVDIDAGAAWAIVENSSINLDLGVAFLVNQPSSPTVFSGFPWAGVVQAGGSKRFLLPANDGSWTGRIWLYPLSVASQSAATGTISGYSRAYVTSFSPSEAPQDFQGVIRGLDLTSQPRVISLPMPNLGWTTPGIALPADAGSSLKVGGAYVLSAANLAAGRSCFYLYSLYAWPINVGWSHLQLFGTFQDATHAQVGSSFQLADFTVGMAGSTGPSQLAQMLFPQPKCWNTAIPATAVEIQLVLTLQAGFGGQSIRLDYQASLDLTNSNSSAEYGNWSLHSGSGSVF